MTAATWSDDESWWDGDDDRDPPPGPAELVLEQQYHEAACGLYDDLIGAP